jgi:CubicO group peptidase (beta-lactamase class C family)
VRLGSLLALVVLACAGSAGAAAPGDCRETVASAHYREAIAAARPLVDRMHEGLRPPGMTLAVAVRGRVVWSVACGYADLAARRPAVDGTRFRIGSVSKTLTATAPVSA